MQDLAPKVDPSRHLGGDLLRRFNPRARMGRDEIASGGYYFYAEFQSTRPHGARLIMTFFPLPITRFNPRARMGRDVAPWTSVENVSFCFNPRARMGRDEILETENNDYIKFQSTRPHGARLRAYP